MIDERGLTMHPSIVPRKEHGCFAHARYRAKSPARSPHRGDRFSPPPPGTPAQERATTWGGTLVTEAAGRIGRSRIWRSWVVRSSGGGIDTWEMGGARKNGNKKRLLLPLSRRHTLHRSHGPTRHTHGLIKRSDSGSIRIYS